MAQKKLFQVGVKALITNKKGEVLILDSGDWHLKHQTRHWDIPGGRIQEGQTVLETLLREVEEETGIKKVTESELFTSVVSNFKGIPINGNSVGLILMIYKVKIPKNSKITLSQEHSGFKWASPHEAAEKLAYKYPVEFTQKLL